MPPIGQQDTLYKIRITPQLLSAPPYKVGVGKLGSMYGELTSIRSMASDKDLNLRPSDH